jgi:hypothetical protein
MNTLITITRREFASYFSTPLAFVFIIVFLLANGLATFYLGAYFAVGQADLTSFFMFHPWLYLFFLPAISMRLWAEERRNGSIELLLTFICHCHRQISRGAGFFYFGFNADVSSLADRQLFRRAGQWRHLGVLSGVHHVGRRLFGHWVLLVGAHAQSGYRFCYLGGGVFFIHRLGRALGVGIISKLGAASLGGNLGLIFFADPFSRHHDGGD